MLTELSGTIVQGAIRVNGPIELPDDCHVRIILEPFDEPAHRTSDETWAVTRDQRQAAFQEWMRRCQAEPINSGGLRFNRDELYERD